MDYFEEKPDGDCFAFQDVERQAIRHTLSVTGRHSSELICGVEIRSDNPNKNSEIFELINLGYILM